MHPNSYQIMTTFKTDFLGGQAGRPMKILDVGSQDITGPGYRPIFSEPSWSYQGLDIVAGPNVDIVVEEPYSWSRIPGESYDVVISGQVFEHVEYFWLTMLEMSRVLKSNGWCCLIVPSHGPEHRVPVDCYRFYVEGMVALAKFAGLQVRRAETQWATQAVPDSQYIWHDSLLVAQKPEESPARRLQRYLQHKVLQWSAFKTEADAALPKIVHASPLAGLRSESPNLPEYQQELIIKQQAEIDSLLQVCREREAVIHQLSDICEERLTVINRLDSINSRRQRFRLMLSRLRGKLSKAQK